MKGHEEALLFVYSLLAVSKRSSVRRQEDVNILDNPRQAETCIEAYIHAFTVSVCTLKSATVIGKELVIIVSILY